MTRQQQADLDLARWQALRAIDMTPEQRIEALFVDFFRAPPPCDVEYAIIERQVGEAMREIADV